MTEPLGDSSRPEPVIDLTSETLDAVWQVRRAIEALPADEETIVRLQHIDGMTHREISEKLGVAAPVAASVLIALVAGIVVGHREVDPNFKADLTATALAPGARASAEMYHTEAGFRVSLEAHGLPDLPPGEYYQAWLRNAHGRLVPIGTFSSSDGHVTLWSGVSPNDFPTLTVTIEATDNDRAPREGRVLAGDTHAA